MFNDQGKQNNDCASVVSNKIDSNRVTNRCSVSFDHRDRESAMACLDFFGVSREFSPIVSYIVGYIKLRWVLDNDEVVINGVRFLGSTLWTDFLLFGEDSKNDAMYTGKVFLNDFRLIHEGIMLFTPLLSTQLHAQSLAWLTEKLNTPFESKTVVVTHHLPSALSVVERF